MKWITDLFYRNSLIFFSMAKTKVVCNHRNYLSNLPDFFYAESYLFFFNVIKMICERFNLKITYEILHVI